MEEISVGYRETRDDTGCSFVQTETDFLRDFLFNTIESFQCHWNEETFEIGVSIENNEKRKGGFLSKSDFFRPLDELFFFFSYKMFLNLVCLISFVL